VTQTEFTEWCELSRPSALFGISIFFLQTFGLISKNREYFGVLNMFNIEIEETFGQCMAPGLPLVVHHLGTVLLEPVLVVAVVGMVITISKLRKRAAVNDDHTVSRQHRTASIFKRHHLQRASINVAQLLFAPLTRGCISLFLCREVPAYGTLYLVADMSIECYTGEHLVAIIISFCTLITYAIGMPIFFIYKVRGELSKEKIREEREQAGLPPSGGELQPRCWDTLYAMQHSGAYWWFLVLVSLKLVVNVLFLVGEITPTFNWGVWLQLALILVAMISKLVHPYLRTRDNVLEQVTLLLLAGVMCIVNSTTGKTFDGSDITVILLLITCGVATASYLFVADQKRLKHRARMLDEDQSRSARRQYDRLANNETIAEDIAEFPLPKAWLYTSR
jgi:hypothetical protein